MRRPKKGTKRAARKPRFLVGIDEAGRGPLAGPVSVGAVLVSSEFDFRLIEGVRDSKQCSEKEREAWYERARILQAEGKLSFASVLVGASHIDRRGISASVRLGIKRLLVRLEAEPHRTEVRLDGLLYAPQEFSFQKTIVRGDQIEPIISLASIVAKVRRDRHMVRLARRYPLYQFELHKGYGTALHYKRLKKHGVSAVHRLTYLSGLSLPQNHAII